MFRRDGMTTALSKTNILAQVRHAACLGRLRTGLDPDQHGLAQWLLRSLWQDETNQSEVSAMAPDRFSSRILQLGAIAFLVAAGCLFLPLQSSAREGLTGCTVTIKKPNWMYKISLIVPEKTICKVYVWDDHPTMGGWAYRWQKLPSHNPIVDESASDLINTPGFTDWKVQARCRNSGITKTFEMKCTPK